jgi:uncharacterized glyoxalase superfamily protein PhnB
MTVSLDAIGIIVTDMGESIAFYQLLGLEFPEGSSEAPHAEAVLPSGMRLLLDTEDVVAGFDASFTPPTSRGRIGLAVRCASPGEVDEVFRTIVAVGHRPHLEPFDAFWGQRYAGVQDPDGNVIDLYAALDGQE